MGADASQIAVLLFRPGIQFGPWIPAFGIALCAGVLDWRFRRIPNWLTVLGAVLGIVVNTILFRWPGLKAAVLGMLLGLALLLPFVWVRSLGAGDWKLVGALGACLGPRLLTGRAFWRDPGGRRDGARRHHLERTVEADAPQYRTHAGGGVQFADAGAGGITRQPGVH